MTIVDEPTWYGIWQICKHGYFADKWLLTQEDFLGKVWLWKKVNNKLVFGWNLNCQCSKNANEFWKDCSKVQTFVTKKIIEEQKIQAYWLSYLCFALVETWYVNLLFVLFMFGLDKRPSSTILCSGPREIYPARHIYLLVAAKRVPSDHPGSTVIRTLCPWEGKE